MSGCSARRSSWTSSSRTSSFERALPTVGGRRKAGGSRTGSRPLCVCGARRVRGKRRRWDGGRAGGERRAGQGGRGAPHPPGGASPRPRSAAGVRVFPAPGQSPAGRSVAARYAPAPISTSAAGKNAAGGSFSSTSDSPVPMNGASAYHALVLAAPSARCARI